MNAIVTQVSIDNATTIVDALNTITSTKAKKVLSPFEAGELEQSSVIKITEALRAALPAIVDETDDAYKLRFEPVRIEYMKGHMRKALNITSGTAGKVFDLLPYKEDGDDTRRDAVQQAAYNNAKVAFGRAIARANIKTGNAAKATKKSGANTDPKEPATKDAPVALTKGELHVPTCETLEAIAAHMALVAAHLAKFHDHNAKFFTGDKGMVYRDLIASFNAVVKKEATAVTIDNIKK